MVEPTHCSSREAWIPPICCINHTILFTNECVATSSPLTLFIPLTPSSMEVIHSHVSALGCESLVIQEWRKRRKGWGRLSSSYTRWKWVTSSLTAFRGVTSPVQLGGPEDQTYQHIRTMVEQFSSAVTEE